MKHNTLIKTLVFLLVLSAVSTISMALVPSADASSCVVFDGSYEYVTDGGNIDTYEATILKYNGNEDHLTIQTALEGHPVKIIGARAFQSNINLEEVIIPQSVSNIGDNAFADCSSLKAAYFLGSMPHMGTNVFDNANEGFTIYCLDESWNNYTSHPTAVWNLSIYSDGVNSYSYYIFDNEITIYKHISGRNVSIPSHIENDGKTYPVVSVGPESFYQSDVETIVIESGVENIGERAFSWNHKEGSQLRSVMLPNTLTSIDDEAFRDCTSLESITLPSSLKYIGFEAFRDSGLTSISVPNSVTYLGDGAFYCNYNLQNANVSNALDSLNPRTFGYCTALTSVSLSDDLEFIGDSAFYNCKLLNSIDLSDVEIIGNSAFYGCESLVRINLDDVTSIGNEAFYECSSLSYVEFDSLESIGSRAFAKCSNLDYVVFPDDLLKIDSDAFRACSSMSAAYFEGRLPIIDADAFTRVAADFKLYYLSSNSDSWSAYNEYDTQVWNGDVPGKNVNYVPYAVAILVLIVVAIVVFAFRTKKK